MANQYEGRLHSAVSHEGKTYNPGDEEAFAALDLPADRLQRLQQLGVVSGFGTKEQKAAGTSKSMVAPRAAGTTKKSTKE